MGVQALLLPLSFACLAIAGHLPSANRTDPGPLEQHGRQGSGVVQHTIKHKKKTNLKKRQDPSSIDNENIAYWIDIAIGTPPQALQVVLDTGSSELWVDPTCSNSYNPALCNSLPVYDPYSSSTAQDEGEPFSIQYGTGATEGEYLLDTVNIAGVSIIQQQFGWASSSDFSVVGLLGVGLGYGFGPSGYFTYYNVIDQLYVQGFTASRAFGLNLGSSALSQGTIAFGGIDTGKYIGALEKRPMIRYYNSPDDTPRYWFYMTSVGVTQPGSSSSFILTTPTYNQAIFPDCGATLSQLPTNLFNALIAQFPSAVKGTNGVYTMDCSIRSQPGTLDFGFGGTIVKVPFFEWFRYVGTSQCQFGAVPNDDTWSLGDSFMRSAYIVYDQDNFNIHIAQGANCGSTLVPIGSGANAVPSITGQCKAATSTSTTSSKSSSKTSSSSSTVKTTTTTTKVSSTSSSTKTSSSSSKTSSTSTSSSKSSSLSTSTKPSSTSSKSSTSSSKTSTLSTSSKPTSSTSSKPTSTKSSSLSSTSKSTSSSSKGPTTTFVSSFTTSHVRHVTTIIQK